MDINEYDIDRLGNDLVEVINASRYIGNAFDFNERKVDSKSDQGFPYLCWAEFYLVGDTARLSMEKLISHDPSGRMSIERNVNSKHSKQVAIKPDLIVNAIKRFYFPDKDVRVQWSINKDEACRLDVIRALDGAIGEAVRIRFTFRLNGRVEIRNTAGRTFTVLVAPRPVE